MQAPKIPLDEAERLVALRSLDVLDMPSEERFDRITRLAKALFKVPIALISLVDADRQWFRSRQGLTACETSRDISFCGHAILENKVLWIQDASRDKRFSDNPLVTGELGIRFYAGYPIRASGGQTLGTLCIIDMKPRSFSMEEIALLTDLGRIAARELQALQHGPARLELAGRSAGERKLLIDGVTGMWNRAGILNILREGLAECAHKNVPGTVVLAELDIDARLLGVWSASERDQNIAEIAQVLRGRLEDGDSIGRTRHDQFVAFLRGISVESAPSRVDGIRQQLRSNPVLQALGVHLRLGHTSVRTNQPCTEVERALETAQSSLERTRRSTNEPALSSALSARAT